MIILFCPGRFDLWQIKLATVSFSAHAKHILPLSCYLSMGCVVCRGGHGMLHIASCGHFLCSRQYLRLSNDGFEG